MIYFVLILFSSLIPYLQADPSPDTNVQIQNYDGPIYLHSPKPNYCPFCNSIINSQIDSEPEKDPRESTNDYPRKAIYGNGETPIITGNTAKVNPFNTVCRSLDATLTNNNGNIQAGTYVDSGIVSTSNTAMNTVPLNTGTGTYGNSCGVTTPVNAGAGILGNTYTIPVTFESAHNGFAGNRFCGSTHPTLASTESNCVKPLTSSTSNSAHNVNNCYRIPIVTYNSQGLAEEEPILVPQKFSYSLVLDGEVAPMLNQNQNYPILDCVVL